MPDDKNQQEKQPGEKAPGKYHYNPGNQSAKPVKPLKPKSERVDNVDRQSGHGEEKQ
jgi:hypothetical protein